jgi:hypothetical protein
MVMRVGEHVVCPVVAVVIMLFMTFLTSILRIQAI